MQEDKPQNAVDVITRLKKLLKIKTDAQLAGILNVRANTISTWKKRNSLDYDSIIAICELYEFDLNQVFLNQKKGSGFSTETPLITREVQFQYSIGNDNEALLEILPKYHFPFVTGEDSRAFQVLSNNMFPLIEENCYVICESVLLEDVTENLLVVVVSKQKGMFISRIHKASGHEKYILSSENENFHDINVDAAEVSEVWKICGVLSYDLNHDTKFKFINDSLKKINKFLEAKKISQ